MRRIWVGVVGDKTTQIVGGRRIYQMEKWRLILLLVHFTAWMTKGVYSKRDSGGRNREEIRSKWLLCILHISNKDMHGNKNSWDSWHLEGECKFFWQKIEYLKTIGIRPLFIRTYLGVCNRNNHLPSSQPFSWEYGWVSAVSMNMLYLNLKSFQIL
jgi:hypothetical protein